MNFDAVIWCDGSYYIHGGAAAVLVNPTTGRQMVVSHGELNPTSNQRMELLAAIIGLQRLWWRASKDDSARIRSKKRVAVYSDSAYLVNCFLEGWIEGWREVDWRNSRGKPVKNRELWETLESLVIQYKEVKFIHVKGHVGTPLNELADKEAGLARISFAARAARLNGETAVPKDQVVGAPLAKLSGSRRSKLKGRRGRR